jgi:hypothetical protein
MAGNLSNYLENKLLDHSTGRAAYTAPTTTYLALYTVAPTDGTGGTEVSASGYARQAITWGAAASGSIATSANVRFPAAGTAAADYGTVVALGILDALTSGNLLWYGSLSASVTISTGDSYTITSGGLTLTLD